MSERPGATLRRVRLILWALVGLAVAGAATLLLMPRTPLDTPGVSGPAAPKLGGAFTLTGGDGRPFSSTALAGNPYAIFFGFTRCGDVCPVTLGRLARLREQAGGAQAFNILFVTIDPANDGPKEVGQYAEMFETPIIGLTGSAAQIAAVKKQYGIYAEPNPEASRHGDMISHTSSVLLFDRDGRLAGTIAGDEPDPSALQKLKQLIA